MGVNLKVQLTRQQGVEGFQGKKLDWQITDRLLLGCDVLLGVAERSAGGQRGLWE